MTFQALRMLNHLLEIRDSLIETDTDGVQWAQVCTADMTIPGIETKQIAGYLSALQTAGQYRKTNKYFGKVRLPERYQSLTP